MKYILKSAYIEDGASNLKTSVFYTSKIYFTNKTNTKLNEKKNWYEYEMNKLNKPKPKLLKNGK